MKKDGKCRRELPGSGWYPGEDVLGWVAIGGWKLTGFIARHPDDLTQPKMPSLGQITHTFRTRSVSPRIVWPS